MTSPDAFLAALPMRDIKERAGTYGNCGGVAFAYVHLERGTGDGVEMVDVLEDLPDYAEDFRDLIDGLIGYIAEGISDCLAEAFDGVVPPVRVLIYMIDPNPAHANPTYHRRAGRRVAEEALRRAERPAASQGDLLRALPLRGVTVCVGSQSSCAGIARVEVDVEAGTTYPSVEVVDAVEVDDELREIADMCVENVWIGVQSAFRVLLGDEPAVRVVVRRVLPHLVDANESINRRAGRAVVEEVLRRVA